MPNGSSHRASPRLYFGSRGFKGDYLIENELKDALLRIEVRFGIGPECVGLYLADAILQGAPTSPRFESTAAANSPFLSMEALRHASTALLKLTA